MTNSVLGQRQTRQRDAILQVIMEADGPLAVPEILARAQQSQPQLGVATVYRTLKILLEAVQIQTVILASGETRYESAALGHHHHFQCRLCQEVFDFAACPLHHEPGAQLPAGFIVENHEITLYGLCAACAGKAPSAPSTSMARKSSRRN